MFRGHVGFPPHEESLLHPGSFPTYLGLDLTLQEVRSVRKGPLLPLQVSNRSSEIRRAESQLALTGRHSLWGPNPLTKGVVLRASHECEEVSPGPARDAGIREVKVQATRQVSAILSGTQDVSADSPLLFFSLLDDPQALDLIFAPGFSTAAEVMSLSGRGVGLDVVKHNIQSLNGHILTTTNLRQGAKFSLRLPLTLATVEALMIETCGSIFALPVTTV
ncbi:MAG: hypothetical protein E3J45_02820 [Candidatus Zixiibacteriota bacterium]|nr:MAG: hypothetical protein E3J45_02820 [candidate division Zixibacteria bacterium]